MPILDFLQEEDHLKDIEIKRHATRDQSRPGQLFRSSLRLSPANET